MKRISITILLIAVSATMLFSQVDVADRPDVASLPFGDARATGLAGAMTAVNDDMNTLFFNPAGLTFLRHNYFNIDMAVGTSVFVNTNKTGPASLPENYYTPLSVQPEIVFGGKHWGVALVADYLSYKTNDYLNQLSDLPVHTSRRIGGVAGLGFNLGPVALGANVKVYNTSNYDFSVANNPLDFGGLMNQMLFNSDVDLAKWDVGMGLGAIVTFGSLNVGAYYDNLMPFINAMITKEEYSVKKYLQDCFETMSLGVSWMPTDNKFSKAKFPLTLIASADLKNLGSSTARQFCAGFEAGVDFKNFLVLTGRLGYTQGLPSAESFSFRNGMATAGITAKLSVVKVDFSLLAPFAALKSTVGGEDLEWTEAKLRATVSICL